MADSPAKKKTAKKSAASLVGAGEVDEATEETSDVEQSKDLEIILPEPGKVEIQGVECSVRRLRMREFFKMMSIVTNGLGPNLAMLRINTQDAQEMNATLVAAFLMAIPNQIPQFIEFVQEIIEPHGSSSQVRLVKNYLDNPEIEDILPVIDAILNNESDNIRELMGKARAYLVRWQEMFQRAG